jgi:hypothetical protein
MKKAVIRILLIFIFPIVSIVSCKKGSNNIAVSGNTSLLTQQEWKLNKQEVKINSDPYIDRFPSLPPCTQDDKYSFKIDNTYELNEGATKCNSSSPQVIMTGTWQFTQNETKIKIDAVESSIDKLDNNTLIISGSYYTNPDTNYYRNTFVH